MEILRLQITVEGNVQGVGFRPFVYSLGTRFSLTGWVSNNGLGALIEAEGKPENISRFLCTLESEAPPLALIERVRSKPIPSTGDTSFQILPSTQGSERHTWIAPDVGTCPSCLKELFDPHDRRFRYPFITCTDCGPRFTIIQNIPYDRPATTMAAFALCLECSREFHDPEDRRFHAQAVACPACGPQLRLINAQGQTFEDDPILHAASLIQQGAVVAIKGLGGYHLAADALSEQAAGTLRTRKRREEKPFAVMMPDVDLARLHTSINPEEEALLKNPRHPIVLLARLSQSTIAEATAPHNQFLGVMLPYTPLHHLLCREIGRPLILTSGNTSDEPIVYRDAEALARLQGIADAFLTHDRGIHIRTDDSVTRIFRGAPIIIRRSRGYAPQPIRLPWKVQRTVLACGAELKNTVCAAKHSHAFLSPHIGDLENFEAFRSFTEAMAHFQQIFDIQPDIIAHDLHPDYLSTKWALEQHHVNLLGVQHHHAHLVSCLADNQEPGPVIGVAFDGLGYGADATLWGGEFLIVSLDTFTRSGHLAVMPMPGGTAAIKEPWRMAAVYLEHFAPRLIPRLGVFQRHQSQWEAVLSVAQSESFSPTTSSVGRLFDAVSAILGIRDAVTYEGQAAIELEQIADPREAGSYHIHLEEGGGGFQLYGGLLIQAIVHELLQGVSIPIIAARFHNSLAEGILAGCQCIRDMTGLATVALSGGVFQNQVLLTRTLDRLEAQGFRVLHHRQVPSNDGGISLGQAVIAGCSAGTIPIHSRT